MVLIGWPDPELRDYIRAVIDEYMAEKKKAETPVKEPRPVVRHDPATRCAGRGCGYEVGGKYDCEY